MKLKPWKKERDGQGPSEMATVDHFAPFHGSMGEWLEKAFKDPWGLSWPLGEAGGWNPAVDVSETEKEFVVRAEVPGVDPKELDVSVEGRTLTLSGEKREDSEQESEGLTTRQRRFGSFAQSFTLPEVADAENLKAQCANGVLTLKIPKLPAARARRIEVRSG